MNKSESYIIVYDWMRQSLGNTPACNLFALLCSFKDDKGMVQISQGYMAHRLCCDAQAVVYNLKKLQAAGAIEIVTPGGAGRSAVTTYRVLIKGGEISYPKTSEKGMKNNPLKNQKGYEKSTPKRGLNFTPNNKQLLNNAAIAANAPARAGELENGFSKFWELFQPASEYQDRKRACREQWGKMDETTRSKILQELSTGKPNRANPLFYLLYYGEEQATEPVKLTMYDVYKRYNTTEPAGYCILAEHDLNGAAYWCKTEDAKRAGWQIQREFN